jgi:hypothetical protein
VPPGTCVPDGVPLGGRRVWCRQDQPTPRNSNLSYCRKRF